MSHVFFSKDVMDEHAYTGVTMSDSSLHAYRIWRWTRHDYSYNHRTNLMRVQVNLTAQRFRNDILKTHMLNVIDRQMETFQQENIKPHTARVAMDFLAQNNINVLSWPSK
jgi:hypothetical protein